MSDFVLLLIFFTLFIISMISFCYFVRYILYVVVCMDGNSITYRSQVR